MIANKIYTNATNQLCSTLSCPCGLTDKAIENSGYTAVEQTYLKALDRSNSKVVRYQQCTGANKFTQQEKDIAESLKKL